MNDQLAQFLAEVGERYDSERQAVGVEWSGPGYHTRVVNGTWAHPTRESLDYALALLRGGEAGGAARASDIVRKVLTMQDTDPTSRTYGIWPWLLEEPLDEMAPPDWNWADFCGIRLAHMLVDHAESMPAELRTAMRTAVGHAGWSVFRRNVQPSYTNIAIMGAGLAAIAGEVLDEAPLLEYGRRRLRNVVEHTAFHGGFSEYNSPTYTLVALNECERILHLVNAEDIQEDARALWQHAWQTVADHFHPGTGQWAGPHSRAYADRLAAPVAGFLAEQMGVPIAVHPQPGGRPMDTAWRVTIDHLPGPPELVARFRALPKEPTVVRQRFVRRASDALSTWGTTWLAGDICLGSVNHDTLWVQRRPVIGYWRSELDPAMVLRVRFLRDGQDFASALIHNHQSEGELLSAVSLLTDKGDFHDHLDRPADGIFEAEDFRLRYELTGEGVSAEVMDVDRLLLVAAPYQAVIHTCPGQFGSYSVVWEVGQTAGQAHVDGICYRGKRRRFPLAEVGEVVLAAGLELLTTDQRPAESSPEVRRTGDDLLSVTWRAAGKHALAAPLTARTYAAAVVDGG